MKLYFASIVFAISILSTSQAQHPILYGTTTSGNGGIFRFSENDNELTNVYRFKNSGIYRRSHMVRGNDGIVYGVAHGGPYGHGIIYSLDPVTNKYTIRKSFKEGDGDSPNSSLVQATDGKLYGITATGGINGNGVLFSIDPLSSAFHVELQFNDVFASSPTGLNMASDGRLYGIVTGGPDYKQLIYSFDPISKEFQAEAFFPEEFGSFPSESMIEGQGDGSLYGLMSFGGDNETGTLFSYSLSSKEITKLFDFTSASGTYPNGTLTLGSDGKFYSTTSSGGANKDYGTVFCFDPQDKSVKAIHDFDGVNGGSSRGGLAEGEDGRLYGLTLKAVPKGRNLDFIGSIFFSIDKNGDNYKVIRDFDHPGRSHGEGNFILVNHKLYGSALAETPIPYDYIFSYESSEDLFQKIIRANEEKGYEPRGGLLEAPDGRFYGLAYRGGGFGFGGIFSFNPGSRVYKMLFPFSIERGYIPHDNPVIAGNGKIYGTTSYGGKKNSGVIFSYDIDKSRYTIEKSFKGYRPVTGFATCTDGNLYSTFQREVTTDAGLDFEYQVFSYNPASGKYKELTKLCCGRAGIFTEFSDGKLYASGEGGIYIYDPSTNSVDMFLYPDQTPNNYIIGFEKLVEAADHKLYGLAYIGPGDGGIIFSFDPSDRSFIIHFTLNEDTRPSPRGSLRYASDGKFYGTTSADGNNQLGTLFSFDPITQSFQVLKNFDQFTGGIPGSGELVELNTSNPPIVSITDKKLFEGETAELTVSLNRISMEATTLNYRTVPGTANDGGKNPDFTSTSGQVTIPPGEISTTISVSLLEDELIENRETFTVVLQKANEALFELGDSIGVINIKNGTAPVIPPGGEIIAVAPIVSNASETVVKDGLLIRATPNPSSDFFRLHLSGRSTGRVSVTVTNLSGQVLDKFDNASINAELVFGQHYPGGNYFVRIVDGKKSRVIKLIKTSK